MQVHNIFCVRTLSVDEQVLQRTIYNYRIYQLRLLKFVQPKFDNNSRTSRTFQREIKIKSTIPKLILIPSKLTVWDDELVAGRECHELEPADGRTDSER